MYKFVDDLLDASRIPRCNNLTLHLFFFFGLGRLDTTVAPFADVVFCGGPDLNSNTNRDCDFSQNNHNMTFDLSCSLTYQLMAARLLPTERTR